MITALIGFTFYMLWHFLPVSACRLRLKQAISLVFVRFGWCILDVETLTIQSLSDPQRF
jgi:hypothetical protein